MTTSSSGQDRNKINQFPHNQMQPNHNVADLAQADMAVAGRCASGSDRIVLPLPPSHGEEARFEMEVYARFMRHLRHVPNSRMEIKILSAIHFTSDIMDTSDALVSKTLADLGLRAPRKAFPMTFLDFVDKSTMRSGWDLGSPPASVSALKRHWDEIGEDRFATLMRSDYGLYNSNVYAEL